jgi:6-phosphofructokinase 1
LVYLPERTVSPEKFLGDVEAAYSDLGRCVVAVSEGIRDSDGTPWAKKLAVRQETDAHGNIQLSGTAALADFLAASVKEKLGVKRVRADTFGYLQRSFASVRSKVDVKEAAECGAEAVRRAMSAPGGSIAIRRTANAPKYASELFLADLEAVAAGAKSMPDEFINAAGNGVTDAFVRYAKPLVGSLPKTAYLGSGRRV